MFYRYAYIIILASITLALVLARLSYTVTLKMTHATMPTAEIARLIAVLDLPAPRSVTTQGRNIVLRFNPFIAPDKKWAFESLINQLDNSVNRGSPLRFQLYLNEPSLELFNYFLQAMGNSRNFEFTLAPQKATINLIPYAQGKHEKFECHWAVDAIPPLPNLRVPKSSLTHNHDDDDIMLQAQYTIRSTYPEHSPLTQLMKLTSSHDISFVIDEAIELPVQGKNNLLMVQRLCNKALLKQGNAMLTYVLFPMLTSELRGATFEYDLSNDLLKL